MEEQAAPAHGSRTTTGWSSRRTTAAGLEGTGFVGDFRRREFVFTGPVQGTYVWTGEEEDE